MQKLSRNDGFTLVELMTSSLVTLLVLAGAVTAFQNALRVNDAGQQLSDSSHNLRSGANLLIHDLMQAGRKIPTGGIPIPNGTGATPINRPSPPGGPVYTFNNTTQSTLMSVTSGHQLGPTLNGSPTDIITFLMLDPLLGDTKVCDASISPQPTGTPEAPICPAPGGCARLATDGSSLTLTGTQSSSVPPFNWLVGDPTNGVAPVAAGDLIFFNTGSGAIRTVTSTNSTQISFASSDWFNFNQTAAANGTLQKLRAGSPLKFPCGFAAARLLMHTYYLHPGDSNVSPPIPPRLTRVLNHNPDQYLAGVVDDLDFTYDLVDGTHNPVQIPSLPYTAPLTGLIYNATQIRKVNIGIGVRSETISTQTRDYIRSRVGTVVSLRNLAFTPFLE